MYTYVNVRSYKLHTYAFLLEFVFNPRILVVDNQEVGSVITCIIPECDTTTLSCLLSRGLSEEDIEWLNPSNVVINSTSTNRIYSKKL